MPINRRRLFIFASLIALLLITLWGSDEVTVPPELIGVWVTSAPQYQGRSFVLQPDLLIFQTGPNEFIASRIKRIETKWDAVLQATVHTIDYQQEGGPMVFPIYFFPLNPPVIRFKNQPEITWTRVAS